MTEEHGEMVTQMIAASDFGVLKFCEKAGNFEFSSREQPMSLDAHQDQSLGASQYESMTIFLMTCSQAEQGTWEFGMCEAEKERVKVLALSAVPPQKFIEI